MKPIQNSHLNELSRAGPGANEIRLFKMHSGKRH